MHDHTEKAAIEGRCPRWCRRTHGSGTHPDDEHHASRPRFATVTTGRPTLDPDELAAPCGVVARLVRRTDSDVTWVEVVAEEGRDVRLVVTLESLRPLLAILAELADTAAT